MKKHLILTAFSFSCVAGMARGGLPADYNEGFIEHAVRVPRLPAPVAVTTDLNQPPWTEAAMLTGNLDWRRIRTADRPITTYLFYTDRDLWLGYRCEVKPGDKLKAEIRERDGDLKKDDHVNIELDVGPTGRVFYRFMINSLGTVHDSVIIDKRWNSHAEIKTAKDARGWTMVIRLPFSDFDASEPAAGSFWKFNIATRTDMDNSWAPVLGGYHAPEQFARLIFGGEKTRPARMMEFKPLHLGENTLRVQGGERARYLIEAIDGNKRVIDMQQGEIPADGRITFQLLSERIDHVNFSFRDAEEKVVLSFWRPAEIPQVLGIVADLRPKAELLRRLPDRLPESVKSNAGRLLGELDGVVGTTTKPFYQDWKKLHKQLVALQRRMTDAWLYAQTLDRLAPQARFAVAWASPMDKVMIKEFPCQARPAQRYDLSLARNEHEAVQVVIVPMAGLLKNLKVTVSAAADKGKPFKGRISTALVGHVETRPAGSYLPDFVGWYPDPILDFQQACDAAEGEHVSFWVNVATDRGTPPGDYAAQVTVSADECTPVELELHIRVWDIDLPDGSHLRNAFTYNEASTRRLYKGKWTKELARRYHDFILDHRLNIDGLYGKEERDVELLRHGASRGMNAFNLFYVGKGADVGVVKSLLQKRMPPLKEAGIDHLAYIYGFDEVNDETFPKIKELFGAVHSLYPHLPRMTTAYDNTFGRTTGLRDYIDIWVPLVPEYNMLEAQRLRAEGKEMWWYICVGPRHPYPNWFVESPAIEARLLMGAMSYKYRVGGVLYFMTNGWLLNNHPITSGPYTDWFPGAGKSREGVYANGDGSLFCAGPEGPVTTIRYENIRDGLEDYEYMFILAETVKAVSARPATIQRAVFLQQARELLTVPDEVVESSSRHTGDPYELYRFRDQVAEAILKGRQLAQ